MKVFVATYDQEFVWGTTAETRQSCWDNVIYGEVGDRGWIGEGMKTREQKRRSLYDSKWRVLEGELIFPTLN